MSDYDPPMTPAEMARVRADAREEGYKRFESERDALRARVRTLEGALLETREGEDTAGPCWCPSPTYAHARGGIHTKRCTQCRAALSGAQPDTAREQLEQRVTSSNEAKMVAQGKVGILTADLKRLAESKTTALAEREASIVELRRALNVAAMALHEGEEFHDEDCPLDDTCDCRVAGTVRAALAQPAPQAALRAMLVKVATNAQQNAHGRVTPNGMKFYTAEELADAVLKGES